jgi:hypothetical protein
MRSDNMTKLRILHMNTYVFMISHIIIVTIRNVSIKS